MTEVVAPLGVLLRHTKSDAPDADQLLILSYNHDLAFFEKVVLGVAQLTGARVTIAADAGMAHHDVYAVRRAGTAYLPGLVRCPGSFHPKLFVLLLEGRATLGIGSGNLSMAGWQGNDELWSWHHATPDAVPAVVPAVGGWLESLASAVEVAPAVADTFRRIGARLGQFAATDETATLVESISGPILDQLPVGPVDELNVYAPFYDPHGEALRQLVERLQPKLLRVAFQPTMTQINGAAVATIVGGVGELRQLAENRYRHGKLIEWTVGGRRWALTGSANVSTSALLRSVASGGNVELGVIAPTDDALLPEGAITTPSLVAEISYKPRESTVGPRVAILAATLGPDGIEVVFAGPTEDARVEASAVDWPPDRWEPIGETTAGATVTTLPALVGGSRLRLRFTDGTFSAVAWVVDLGKVHRTRKAVKAGPKPPEIGEVFRDPAALEKFFLLGLQHQKEHPSSGPSQSTGQTGATPEHIESWEEYLDRVAGRVGDRTLAFSLGLPLPGLEQRPSARTRIIDWDDENPDETGDHLEDETAETVELEPSETLIPLDLTKVKDQVRSRYRTYVHRMIHDWVAPDPHERLYRLRMALLLVAGGAWSQVDDDWRILVLDAVDRLPVENADSDYLKSAGALGLLSLSVVRGSLSSWERGLVENRYDRTVAKLADLLVEADLDRIAEFADGLKRRFGALVDTALAILDRLTTDEISNAVADLLDLGFEARIDGRTIDLPKAVPEPLTAALHALSTVETAAPIAIRALGPDGKFANLLWRPPDLVSIVAPAPGKLLTRHFHYPPGWPPGADVRLSSKLDSSRARGESLPGQPLLAIAAELLAEFDLPEPGPPTEQP